MFKGFDPKALAAAMQFANQFTKTEEGKKLVEQLKGKSSEEVMDKLRKGEIKVDGVDTSQAADVISQNPQLIKTLQNVINKEK